MWLIGSPFIALCTKFPFPPLGGQNAQASVSNLWSESSVHTCQSTFCLVTCCRLPWHCLLLQHMSVLTGPLPRQIESCAASVCMAPCKRLWWYIYPQAFCAHYRAEAPSLMSMILCWDLRKVKFWSVFALVTARVCCLVKFCKQLHSTVVCCLVCICIFSLAFFEHGDSRFVLLELQHWLYGLGDSPGLFRTDLMLLQCNPPRFNPQWNPLVSVWALADSVFHSEDLMKPCNFPRVKTQNSDELV